MRLRKNFFFGIAIGDESKILWNGDAPKVVVVIGLLDGSMGQVFSLSQGLFFNRIDFAFTLINSDTGAGLFTPWVLELVVAIRFATGVAIVVAIGNATGVATGVAIGVAIAAGLFTPWVLDLVVATGVAIDEYLASTVSSST